MRKIGLFILTSCFLLPSSTNAQSVDILWHGETYTPPFYQGKTLWSSQSRISLTAIPQGLGAPSSLNYRWTQNGTVLGNVSGVGRSSIFFFDGKFSQPQDVRVEVLSSSNEVLAQNSLVLTPVPTSVLIYEDNPLYGVMFNRELGASFEMREPEITLSAFPLFFETGSRTLDAVGYSWRAGQGNPESSSSVTYRFPESQSGRASVRVNLEHRDKIMQRGERGLQLIFNTR